MKLLPLFHLFCITAALGQQPAAPGGKASATPAPGRAAPLVVLRPTDLVLARDWEAHLTPASGAPAVRLADLKVLLEGFGAPMADTSEHPIVVIYDGQKMDGAAGDSCRISYLMPLPQAEALLFKKRVPGPATRLLTPGLPEGLILRTYPVQAGIYTKLILVTDDAKPQPQVVSLVLKAEGTNYYPPTPYKKIEREWHSSDYFTQVPGQGQIDTRVYADLTGSRMIIVNTTGRALAMLDELAPPGMIVKPAKAVPKDTLTWYVPEPLIRLMLYCVEKQLKQ